MKSGFRVTILLLVFLVSTARADVLVLVHGYLSDGNDWVKSGVAQRLAQAGWSYAGQLQGVGGVIRLSGGHSGGDRRFFTVSLPDEAPLRVQAQWLAAYLSYIRPKNESERLILVGHSAGGLVARLTMVQHPELSVDTLVTIATPHLGTDRAELGLLAGNSPVGMLANMLGNQTLDRSRGLYTDLAPEQRGNLLFWLNRQEHPKARYVSIVRYGEGGLLGGDNTVPVWSQDMNRVAALRGRSEVVTLATGHGLVADDGKVLVKLVQ
ncbi:MAG: alpha/beta hydrolase [Chromatiales bacterium]|nr:alpha/beta hydrolase [Chromatiales bacterium]